MIVILCCQFHRTSISSGDGRDETSTNVEESQRWPEYGIARNKSHTNREIMEIMNLENIRQIMRNRSHDWRHEYESLRDGPTFEMLMGF